MVFLGCYLFEIYEHRIFDFILKLISDAIEQSIIDVKFKYEFQIQSWWYKSKNFFCKLNVLIMKTFNPVTWVVPDWDRLEILWIFI